MEERSSKWTLKSPGTVAEVYCLEWQCISTGNGGVTSADDAYKVKSCVEESDNGVRFVAGCICEDEREDGLKQ